MAENKPTNRERLREITDGIEQGIKELFESEKYMRYLSVMSRFHRYSVNNTMLIYMQKSDATLVPNHSLDAGMLPVQRSRGAGSPAEGSGYAAGSDRPGTWDEQSKAGRPDGECTPLPPAG